MIRDSTTEERVADRFGILRSVALFVFFIELTIDLNDSPASHRSLMLLMQIRVLFPFWCGHDRAPFT
jgi:hypothetical protein